MSNFFFLVEALRRGHEVEGGRLWLLYERRYWDWGPRSGSGIKYPHYRYVLAYVLKFIRVHASHDTNCQMYHLSLDFDQKSRSNSHQVSGPMIPERVPNLVAVRPPITGINHAT
eukprot:SAG31_NODE_62_length_28678_cov_21.548270_10_plen_114_part_00